METIYLLVGLAVGAIVVLGILEFVLIYFRWKDKQEDKKKTKD